MSHHRRVRAWVQRYPIVAFVVMAYGFTWIAWAPTGYLAGGDEGVQTMLMLFGGWGPALAAIVVARSGKPVVDYGKNRGVRVALFMAAAVAGFLVLVWRFRTGGRDVLLEGPGAGQASFSGLPLVSAVLGTAILAFVISNIYSSDQGVRSLLRGLVRWRVHPAYYAFALLIFPVLGLVGAVFARLIEAPLPAAAIGGHPWEAWVPLVLSSFMLTFLFTGGVNEEVGWRGFLLPQLQRRFSPLVAAVIVGAVWEVWHLPLILNGFYPGGILIFLVRMPFLIVLSIIYTWLYNRTGGSVLLMVLLHASFNNYSVVLPATAYAFIPTVLVVGGLVVKDRMYRRIPTVAQEGEGVPAV